MLLPVNFVTSELVYSDKAKSILTEITSAP